MLPPFPQLPAPYSASRLLRDAGLALCITLVVASFSTSGVIDMALTIWLLVAAWLVGVIALIGSDTIRRRSVRHRLTAGVASAILLAVTFIAVGAYELHHGSSKPLDSSGFLARTIAAIYGVVGTSRFQNALCFCIGTLVGFLLQIRRRDSRSEVLSFFNSWLVPASQSMDGVMQRVIISMQKHASDAVRGQVGLIQRSIIDEEKAAFAALSNALSGPKPLPNTEVQERIGKYYRAYQHSRTWIAKGLSLTFLNLSTDAVYQEWLRQDLDLLREIRRLYGPSQYDILRAHVLGVGFGETITRDLLAAGFTNPPGAPPSSPTPQA